MELTIAGAGANYCWGLKLVLELPAGAVCLKIHYLTPLFHTPALVRTHYFL
jgi:hypothetical protein